MNIFYLDSDPVVCAQMHCDKHVVKMILESCQLLSTAHRVLDGHSTIEKSASGRNVKRWYLNDLRQGILYGATHINHPSAIWCREIFFIIHGCVNFLMHYLKNILIDMKRIISVKPLLNI